jgi:hypothetical protein
LYLYSPGLIEQAERDDRKSAEVAVYPTVVMNMGWPWSKGWVDIQSCITAGEVFGLRECMICLGVTGFDPSGYQVGRGDAVPSN